MELRAVSENAIMLYLGDSASPDTARQVQAAVAAIERGLAEELIDLVPSYASVLVIYDPLQIDHLEAGKRIRQALAGTTSLAADSGNTVTLPVYYATETGADLAALAQRNGLSVDDVINLHSSAAYRVYAIGFAPGFAYLGEVNERIAAPRLSTPRSTVPRGAVAIADRQTAVYPSESPGGWNLIGRCPLPMFDPASNPCMPVSVGDEVRFEPITRDRYLALGGDL